MRSPSGSRVNALKRGSIIGSQSLLGQPFGSGMSDGRLSPTPSYATSIDEVSPKGLTITDDRLSPTPLRPALALPRISPRQSSRSTTTKYAPWTRSCLQTRRMR
jgi:hypothetical protein